MTTSANSIRFLSSLGHDGEIVNDLPPPECFYGDNIQNGIAWYQSSAQCHSLEMCRCRRGNLTTGKCLYLRQTFRARSARMHPGYRKALDRRQLQSDSRDARDGLW